MPTVREFLGHTRNEMSLKELPPICNGYASMREYTIWNGMKTRCTNSKNPAFARYGGRGIKVCNRWRDSFENFMADMGPCPAGYCIERKNNDGDYSPENCRWIDRNKQNWNKCNSRFIELDGRKLLLSYVAESLGVPVDRIRQRLNRGWTPEQAIQTGTFKAGKVFKAGRHPKSFSPAKTYKHSGDDGIASTT